MKTNSENTRTATERNPDAFRASLLATTTIPALRMTFREAAGQTRALLAAHPAIPEQDEAAQEASGEAWERLHNAILSAPAQTFGDLLAKVERVACPHIGARTFLLKEAERGVLEQDIERLHRQNAASADAEILAAFARWKQVVTDLVRRTDGLDDDDDAFAAKCEEVDAIALKVIEPAPETMEGLAAQLYTMFHLEHSGTMENPTDIALNPPFDPDDPHTLAIHTIVNRVKRLGGAGTPAPEVGESLGALFARWEETRARYLADDDRTDEELEALENGLDQIEDRLESEPVRCAADAVAKLGYFLTVSNAMLKNGQVPNLNPRLSSPLDRILAAAEDSAPAMPETVRAPLQALAAGLRQLMQRHVTLAIEARHAVDAYRLPDEVSRAMQAVRVRNMAASAEATIRNPSHEEGLLNTFRGLEEQNRKKVMALAPFMAASEHLNDAMLNVAREHGVVGMHRAWLEGHLASIPAEDGAATEESRLQGGAASEDLQRAWGELSALDAKVSRLPGEALENGEYDAIVEQSRAAAGRILVAPATTIRDMEILNRFALRALILYFGIDEAKIRGWFSDGTLPVDNERESIAALWRAAEGLRNLTDAAPAANDQRQDADAFADTVAAFEAEAPATLALPQEPTGGMVDAGASAAGITPAQFQAAYAAAVEALKLERAA